MWLFLTTSLFGTSDRADKYIQDLFNTHLGALVYPTDHQQDTAVLLLTDEVVDNVLQGQWPAPYSFHASVLDDLLQHRPRAVFVDFFWMNQHKPGAEYLVGVLQQYRARDIPVYLAVPDAGWLESRWPELVGLVSPVAPHKVLDPSDYLARSYPQQVNGMPSAAFAIAEDVLGVRAPHRGPLEIFWGTSINPRNEAWMRVEGGGKNNLLGTLLQGFESVDTPIPYTTTVFVRDLLNPVAETEDDALALLDERLQDRIVVYGASLAGIQDMVVTPTRVMLPGAYYHAMAIDNLLTWGDRFKARLPSRGVPEQSATLLIVLQLSMLLLIAILVCHWKLRPQVSASAEADESAGEGNQEEWRPTIQTIAAVLAVVITGCAIQFFVLDLAVAVWAGFIEILGISVVIERLSLIERIVNFFRCRVPAGLTWLLQKMKRKGVRDA